MIDDLILLVIMIRVIKSVFNTQESSDWPDWLLNHAAGNYWRVVGDHDGHNDDNDHDRNDSDDHSDDDDKDDMI